MKTCFIRNRDCDEECKAFVVRDATCAVLRVLGHLDSLVLGVLHTTSSTEKYPASAPAPEIRLP